MAFDTFKPEVWSAAILVALRKSLVFGSVVNRDYEGEIRDVGDSVTINSVGRPTIGTYSPNTTVIAPENLESAARKLLIDQAKYFAFEVDDVDERQSAGSLVPALMSEAGYALADTVDQFIAGLWTGVNSANNLGTVAVPTGTPTTAYDNVLVPLKVKLDEANVQQNGRWAVIPPWFHGRLLKDDRFIRADASGTAAASVTGFVGTAAGFQLLVSNNAPFITGDDYEVIAGVQGAISFAQQISKVEAYRPENAFSDAVKGLSLYGGKLIRPDALAVAQASQT